MYLVFDILTNPNRATLTEKWHFGEKSTSNFGFSYNSLNIKFVPSLKS